LTAWVLAMVFAWKSGATEKPQAKKLLYTRAFGCPSAHLWPDLTKSRETAL